MITTLHYPTITHRQYAVLRELITGGTRAAELGKLIGLATGPALYQLLGRMEKAGLVRQTTQERVTTVVMTQIGREAYNATRTFYCYKHKGN